MKTIDPEKPGKIMLRRETGRAVLEKNGMRINLSGVGGCQWGVEIRSVGTCIQKVWW